MCQYNFILTSKSTSKQILEPILKESGFEYHEIKNEHICNQIEGLEKLVLTTKGHCDCGSILGIDQFPPSKEIDPEKERKKLRKKKWSETKIQRYLEDKLKNQSRNEGNRELGNKAEEERWLEMIQKMVDTNLKFGLFYHQFNGLIVEERLNLSNDLKIKKSNLKVERLRTLKDGELISISK